MFKIKYVARVLCILFIVNLFITDLKPFATSYSSNGAIGNVDIISDVDVSVESVEAWARSKNATETFVSLAKIYKQYGQARGGVNWVLAYVQAAKETGYGRFGGVLDESYHNPCGLKIPSGGDDYDPNAHKRFDNWEQGVIAHLDHLALYAGANGYPKTGYVESWKDEGLAANETYDPRHIGWFGTTSGILGKATNAIDLGAKWAPSSSYGVELFRLYCDAVKANYLEAKSNLESPANGTVISDGKLNIKGWALHAFGIKEIKVYLEGELVGTLNTGINRSDVNEVYPGYYNGNNSGFEGNIDISRFGEGKKSVEIVIISTNNETQSIIRNIIVGNKLPKLSNLEEPNTNETAINNTVKIKGWALDSSGIKEVRAYIDGKDLGTIEYGISRIDVDNVYPGYINGRNSGFEGIVNVSGVATGNKTLVVKVTANDGTVQTFERSINIPKLQSIGNLEEPNTNETAINNTVKIKGWALDSSGIKEVRAYIDGKDLGTIEYGISRIDVDNVYPGYINGRNSGFEGIVNVSGVATGNKTLIVKVTANDGSVLSFERNINIPDLQSRNCLDDPISNEVIGDNILKIRGWALDSSGIKEVRVYIDDKDFGAIEYGVLRADVNRVYPGYSSGDYAGFEGSINLALMSSGSKKLTIKITANNGSVQTIERLFRYKKNKLVVIDPGHENPGGDPGASATHNGITYIESNLNLQIAVRLKAQLEAKGIEVYMTRYEGSGLISTDSTESLRKRVSVANEMNADFFVSIHHNSFTSESANGFEVYYSTGTPITTTIAKSSITEDGRDLTLERSSYRSRSNTEKVQISKSVATQITNGVSSKLNMYNRGAKDSNLYVCKNTLMPSILVENGFLTNPTEAAKVSTASHQQKLAEIIAEKVAAVLQ